MRQVLAALNHPHIASVYGFEMSGATHALVMELVEGQTLDARLKPSRSNTRDGSNSRAERELSRRVAMLRDGAEGAGSHSYELAAGRDGASFLPSGVYFARIEIRTGARSETRFARTVLVR